MWNCSWKKYNRRQYRERFSYSKKSFRKIVKMFFKRRIDSQFSLFCNMYLENNKWLHKWQLKYIFTWVKLLHSLKTLTVSNFMLFGSHNFRIKSIQFWLHVLNIDIFKVHNVEHMGYYILNTMYCVPDTLSVWPGWTGGWTRGVYRGREGRWPDSVGAVVLRNTAPEIPPLLSQQRSTHRSLTYHFLFDI